MASQKTSGTITLGNNCPPPERAKELICCLRSKSKELEEIYKLRFKHIKKSNLSKEDIVMEGLITAAVQEVIDGIYALSFYNNLTIEELQAILDEKGLTIEQYGEAMFRDILQAAKEGKS